MKTGVPFLIELVPPAFAGLHAGCLPRVCGAVTTSGYRPAKLCRNPQSSLRTHDSACGNLYIIKRLWDCFAHYICSQRHYDTVSKPEWWAYPFHISFNTYMFHLIIILESEYFVYYYDRQFTYFLIVFNAL